MRQTCFQNQDTLRMWDAQLKWVKDEEISKNKNSMTFLNEIRDKARYSR